MTYYSGRGYDNVRILLILLHSMEISHAYASLREAKSDVITSYLDVEEQEPDFSQELGDLVPFPNLLDALGSFPEERVSGSPQRSDQEQTQHFHCTEATHQLPVSAGFTLGFFMFLIQFMGYSGKGKWSALSFSVVRLLSSSIRHGSNARHRKVWIWLFTQLWEGNSIYKAYPPPPLF